MDIEIKAPDGAYAKITTHGANLLSWKPAGGSERLFVSAQSEHLQGAAVRGGVPVVFPQFAELGPLPKHGFVRTLPWQQVDVEEDDAPHRGGAEFAQVGLMLTESAATKAIWPHDFAVDLTVTVYGNTLEIELGVLNLGMEAFSFHAALHTYLRVNDIGKVGLYGLQGMHYRDSVLGLNDCIESAPDLKIAGEVDRIYHAVPDKLEIIEGPQKMLIRAPGFTDTVVWNPGPERAARLKDMEAGGEQRMLCVEAAVIRKPITINCGERWSGRQILTAG